jgi:hypothetical protein
MIMSKVNESGHAKNVANFEESINSIVAFGTRYVPSRESIMLLALQKILTDAKKSIADYNVFLSPYKIAVAERETAFQPLSKLTTRLLNSLKATDTTVQMDETAQTLARKIKGERASAIRAVTTPAEGDTNVPDTKQISASQTSFDNRIDNFDKLIIHLENIPQYKPNEDELKPAALRVYYNDLVDKNKNAKLADVALSNARIARDKVLYEPLTGLTDVAFDTKVYIKSAFGAISPEYKQVAGIDFKTVRG